MVLNQDLVDKKKKLKKTTMVVNHNPESRRKRKIGKTPQQKMTKHFTFNLDEKSSEDDFEIP